MEQATRSRIIPENPTLHRFLAMSGSFVALAAGAYLAERLSDNTAAADDSPISQTTETTPAATSQNTAVDTGAQGSSGGQTYPYAFPSRKELAQAQRLQSKCDNFDKKRDGGLEADLSVGSSVNHNGTSAWEPSKRHPAVHANAIHLNGDKYAYRFRILRPEKYKYCGTIIVHNDRSQVLSPPVKRKGATGQIVDTSTTEAKAIHTVIYYFAPTHAKTSKK